MMLQFVRLILLVGAVAAAQEQNCGAAGSLNACKASSDVNADESGLLQVATPRQSSQQPPGTASAFLEAVRQYEALPLEQREARARSSEPRILLPLEIPVCDFGKVSDCPMATLSTTGFTAVRPRREIWGTSCMDARSPFVFQVYPGQPDKLLLYFQDGGACWDQLSTALPFSGKDGLCTKAISVQDPVGIFDRAEENPYKDFTVVHINYCSGDAHAGDTVHSYGSQSGYNNTRAAVEWAKQNLDKRLEHLAIMGASAGSLGAQVWARTVLSEFRGHGRSYEQAVVVSDSYLGFFPDHTQPRVMEQNFGICSTPLGQGWSKTCGKDLTVQDAVEEEIGMFPDVAFLFINSKADSVQGQFYAAIAFTLLRQFQFLDADALYTKATTILTRYGKHPNAIAFQIDGERHVLLNQRRCGNPTTEDCVGDMYSATPRGPLDALTSAGTEGNSTTLVAWLRKSVTQMGTMRSECHGVKKAFAGNAHFSTSFCDRTLGRGRIRFSKKTKKSKDQ